MSKSGGSMAESVELAAALTYIRSDFAGEAVDPLYDSQHPVANDTYLAESYMQAAERLPQPSEGKQGVALIVGNGGFETAAQLIPGEIPIIICDVSAATLFTQRIILETIREAPAPIEFLSAMEQFGEDYAGLPSVSREEDWPEPIGKRCQTQAARWNSQPVPYFLHSQQAYETAREALMERSIGFRQIDFRNTDQHDVLAADLTAQNAEVALLNGTNAFSSPWSSLKTGIELAERLPFNSGVVVIDSSDAFLQSQVYGLDEWIAFKKRVFAEMEDFTSMPLGWAATQLIREAPGAGEVPDV